MNLTERERASLVATLQNMLDAAGGDFGFTDEIVRDLADRETVKAAEGLLGSLTAKGLIFVDHHKVNGVEWVAQVTARQDLMDALYAGTEPAAIVANLVAHTPERNTPT